MLSRSTALQSYDFVSAPSQHFACGKRRSMIEFQSAGRCTQEHMRESSVCRCEQACESSIKFEGRPSLRNFMASWRGLLLTPHATCGSAQSILPRRLCTPFLSRRTFRFCVNASSDRSTEPLGTIGWLHCPSNFL